MAKRGRPRKIAPEIETAIEPVKEKRAYTFHQAVIDYGVPCTHCKNTENNKTRDVKKTSWGRRHYMNCGRCGKNFVKLTYTTKS